MAKKQSKDALGHLPTWDLKDLYPGDKSPELERDLAKARKDATDFAKKYEGKLEGLSGADLGAAISQYENIDEILSRLMTYAQLRHAEDMSDKEAGRFYQDITEAVTDISTVLLFFTLELNKIDDKTLANQLKDAKAAHYRPWIEDVRTFKRHQLADDMEKILHEKYVSGRAAWIRLYDETFARLRFPLKGKEYNTTEIIDFMSDKDRAKRQAAAETFAKGLEAQIPLFSLIMNTLIKDKATEDKWRKYEKPVSARNLANHVEHEVVEALVTAVKQSYSNLAHRYYLLKAKWLGLERMEYWDRNAPLPESTEEKIPYTEAQRIVYDAYKDFSGELARVGKQFFDNPWVDVPVRPGKSPGAFAHPCVPSVHPYLLWNYQGKMRDVMTLAHELGHGVHQCLANESQGHLMSQTPLTLAETASVFGEMLTFKALLSRTTDKKQRKIMLAMKVEDMLNTAVRQIAFHQFETRLHDARKKGELSAEEIGNHWMAVQSESLGPAFHFADGYRYSWSYISHFIHTPFYVYAYAFGECLVNSLYAVYEESAPGFAEKYLDLLRAGGTKKHKELLAPFKLDATDPTFWSKGLKVVSGFIDELETMA